MAQRPEVAVLMPEVTWRQVISEATAGQLAAIGRPVHVDVANADQARDALGRADAALTGWKGVKLTAELIASAPRLQVIAHTAGSVKGLIDVAAWDREIAVCHAASMIADAVAEMCLLLELLCLRRTHEMNAGMRAGTSWAALRTWEGALLRGKKVGLVGCGYVARKHLQLLRPFGCDVSVYDPYLSDASALALGVRKVDLDTLFRESNVVSNHAPVTPETKALVGARALGLLQPSSVFINTARAYTVDYPALCEELRTGRIYAALDVFEAEPLPLDSPLFTLPNVVLTPHVAGHSADSHLAQGAAMVAEIGRYFAGEPLQYQVSREQLAIMA